MEAGSQRGEAETLRKEPGDWKVESNRAKVLTRGVTSSGRRSRRKKAQRQKINIQGVTRQTGEGCCESETGVGSVIE